MRYLINEKEFKKKGMNSDYICSYVESRIEFDIFIDDAGQTFYVQYVLDGEMVEEVLGAYMTDIIGFLEYRSGTILARKKPRSEATAKKNEKNETQNWYKIGIK